MNPFDRINQMKDLLKEEARTIKDGETITQLEHYKKMLNMLTILTEDLKTAEYNYSIENTEDGSYHTFEEMSFQSKHLTENLVLIQPIAVEEADSIDMQSLCDVFAKLKEANRIKEDVIIIPPYVNVLKAKLALPHKEEDDEE